MTERFTSYDEAISFLFGRINYERLQVEAYSTNDFKLDRMRHLLDLIGDPQERIPTVHVAGTKGKGSTCAMIATALAAAGHRVGLYISPHITSFEERMTVNGSQPSRDEVVSLLNDLLPVIAAMDSLPGSMKPTYFELATAMAWLHFERQQCQFVVLEVGLGGRLDSTNVCRPWVTVITNVSRDHTHVLGSTVGQIAWEKAGIIKTGVPLITGANHPDAARVIDEMCRERGTDAIWLDRDLTVTNRRSQPVVLSSGHADSGPASVVDIRTPNAFWKDMAVGLRGAHQTSNAALAIAALESLRHRGVTLSDDAIRRGIAQVTWPARVEVLLQRPLVVADAAHNWESAKALVATLREDFAPQNRFLIFAGTRDKDISGLLRLLVPAFDTVIFTRYQDNPRGIPVEELLAFVRAVSTREVHLTQTPDEAWRLARNWASPDDLIAITGSFFLVSELRERVLSETGASSCGASSCGVPT